MQPPDRLALFMEIRTNLDAIHELAAAVETELGRLQIHSEEQAISRAFEHLKGLAAKTAVLEHSFSIARRNRRRKSRCVDRIVHERPTPTCFLEATGDVRDEMRTDLIGRSGRLAKRVAVALT
jgi:hypothetical protein